MSNDAKDAAELAHALVAFVDAARLHAKGCFLDDSSMQKQACKGIGDAVAIIASLTGSVDLLLPLLGHAEPGVRLNVALQLIDDHYGRVIPILQDLDVNCVTEAAGSAALALQMYGEPNSGNGFTKVAPSMTPQPRRLRKADV